MNKFFEATKLLNISRLRISIIITIYLLLASLELIGIGMFQSLIISVLSPNLTEENFLLSAIKKFVNLDNAKILIVIFCLFFILKNIVTMVFNYYLLSLFQKYHQILLNKFFNLNNGNKNNDTHDHIKQSQLIGRYIDHFIKLYLIPCFKLINDSIIIFFIIIFLMYLSFEVASISLIYLLGVSSIFVYFSSGILKRNATLISTTEENYKKNIYEMIKNNKEIFAYKIFALFFNEFKKNVFFFTNAEKIYRFFNTISKQILEISIVLIACLFFLFLGNDVDNMMSKFVIIGTFGFALLKLIPSISSVVNSITSIKQSHYAVNQVRKFSKNNIDFFEIEKINNPDLNDSKIYKTEIEMLNFQYPGGKKLINNLNLNAQKGQLVGIQGESGSGKTTLMDIILGLNQPISGKITFYDKSKNKIKNFNNFAYISQNISIFNETIAFNITFQKEVKDKTKLNEIIKIVDLDNLINHKDVYKDKIELDGRDLSGGQKQKIAIARSIYHDKEIILIDEATSNLDLESERKFYQIIKKIKSDKIIFFITHKIADKSLFDKIITI